MTTSNPPGASTAIVDGSDQPTEDRTWIKRTIVADIVIVFVAWALLMLGNQGKEIIPIGDIIVIGSSLMLIAFVTFGGFYLASPATATSRDPWMRNSIAAAFVMFYLFLLTLLLVAPSVRESVSPSEGQSQATSETDATTLVTSDVPFGEEIFNGFTTFLTLVLGFYFAAQATERITETVQSGLTTRVAIANQPELAQQVLDEQQRASRRGGPPM